MRQRRIQNDVVFILWLLVESANCQEANVLTREERMQAE
jgi:hypothetical protein